MQFKKFRVRKIYGTKFQKYKEFKKPITYHT